MDVPECGQKVLGYVHGRFAGDTPADDQASSSRDGKRLGPMALAVRSRGLSALGRSCIVKELSMVSLKIIQESCLFLHKM